MQRPSSSSSDTGSAAGASNSSSRRPPARTRPTLTPGGPRKPTTKPTSPPLPAAAAPNTLQLAQEAQPVQDSTFTQAQAATVGQEERRQSGPPPYAADPAHVKDALARPPQTPTISEPSSSRPSTGVYLSAGAGSVTASPVQTKSSNFDRSSYSEEPGESHALENINEEDNTPHTVSQVASARISASSNAPSIASSLHAGYGTRLSGQSTGPRMTTPAPAPIALPPPPLLDFSPTPVAWKPFTLEAAQWTFSSEELQAIVSRAIRASAEPASIRLLSLQILDHELAEETARLESERASVQAQYRFTMHRRTMLLQSLNALSYAPNTQPASSNSASASPSSSSFNDAPPVPPTSDFAHRLLEITSNLDRLALTLLRISDQLAQLHSLQEVHAASALAVALRKLNASYARRTKDIQTLREKVEQLEAERDEAWRVAEELAQEVDQGAEDEDDFEDLAEEEVVNGKRATVEIATFRRASRISMKLRIPNLVSRIRSSPSPASASRQILSAVSTNTSTSGDAAGPTSAPALADGEAPETQLNGVSGMLPRQRRRALSAASRVTAARTRSIRSSKANLRLPRGNTLTRSPSQYSATGRSRPASLSRADSVHSASGHSLAATRSPMDDSVLPSSTSPGTMTPNASVVPEVPRMPDAAALARMSSVKSIDKDKSNTQRLPPPPLPPIETDLRRDHSTRSVLGVSGQGNASIIDNMNYGASDEGIKGRNGDIEEGVVTSMPVGDRQAMSGHTNEIPSKEAICRPDDAASVSKDDGNKAREIRQTEVNRLSPVNQPDQTHPTVDGNEQSQSASEHDRDHGQSTSPNQVDSPVNTPGSTSATNTNADSVDDSGVPRPLSLARSEHPAALFARMRPPPDSPRDVMSWSGPHSAEVEDDADADATSEAVADASSAESRGRTGYNGNSRFGYLPNSAPGVYTSSAAAGEDERDVLAAEFANAYARTVAAEQAPYTAVAAAAGFRGPLRAQHAQSMLPFVTSKSSSSSLNSLSVGSHMHSPSSTSGKGLNVAPNVHMLPPGAMAPRTTMLPPLPLSSSDIQDQTDSNLSVNVNATGKRPTSLPVTSPVQEQPTKPWVYF